MVKGNKIIERQLVDDGAKRDVMLIHPEDAIQWVATGKFTPEVPRPIRRWLEFTFDDSGSFEREAGRLELAEEVISHAIEAGQVRVALIEHDGEMFEHYDRPLPRLKVLSPDQLSRGRPTLNSDDGLELYVFVNSKAEEEAIDWDDDDYVVFQEFYFIWDDVAQLRPLRDRSEQRQEQIAYTPTLAANAPVPRTSVQHPHQQGGRRGRKPRHYGGPIAAFLARAVREGLQSASEEKDETLGRWLIEEFEALGCTDLPNLRNASSDARGALNTWMGAAAQK